MEGDDDDPQKTTITSSTNKARILKEFDQTVFNSLPRSLRVFLTRYFLRDLTTLALYADAFLIAGPASSLHPRPFPAIMHVADNPGSPP